MQIKFVLARLSRSGPNLTMTIALIITTAISVALVVAGVLVSNMARETQDIYLERVEVMIQLDEDISASDTDCSSEGCREVREILESDDGVETVNFPLREGSMRALWKSSKAPIQFWWEETSPDALPAALHVRLVDPTDTEPIDAVRDLTESIPWWVRWKRCVLQQDSELHPERDVPLGVCSGNCCHLPDREHGADRRVQSLYRNRHHAHGGCIPLDHPGTIRAGGGIVLLYWSHSRWGWRLRCQDHHH